jgi:hypothetical protein
LSPIEESSLFGRRLNDIKLLCSDCETTENTINENPKMFYLLCSKDIFSIKNFICFSNFYRCKINFDFFLKSTFQETAEALDIGERTVERHRRVAKAWLYQELSATR